MPSSGNSHKEVRMSVSAVKNVAKKCNKIADQYGVIIALITATILVLQKTNFLSFGANTAAIILLTALVAEFKQEREKLRELSRDVNKAVKYYLTEDEAAAGRFSYR